MICSFISGCDFAPVESIPDVPEIDTATVRKVVKDQVLKAYKDAQSSPDNIIRVGELALVLHAYGYFEQAEIAYRHALALAPDYVPAHYLRGMCLQNTGSLAKALESYMQASGHEKIGQYALARIAEIHLIQGNWQQALDAITMAMTYNPNNPEFLYLRGRVHMEMGNAEQSYVDLNKALDSGAKVPELYYAAGRVARATGNMEKAIEYFASFDKLKALDIDWPDPLLRQVYSRRKTARSVVDRSRQQLAKGGAVSNAIQQLEDALVEDPEGYEAHVTLVGLYGMTKQFTKAEQHFQRGLDLAPDIAQLHFNLATVRMAQNRDDEAKVALKKTIELQPAQALAWAFLGRIQYREFDKDAAFEHLEKAISLEPTNTIIIEIYVPLLIDEQQYERALEILDYPDKRPKTESRRQLLRASALRLSGNYPAAREALVLAEKAASKVGDEHLMAEVRQEAAAQDALAQDASGD